MPRHPLHGSTRRRTPVAVATLLAVSPLAFVAQAQSAAPARTSQTDAKVPKKARGPAAVPAPGRVVPAPPPPSSDRPESVSVVPGPQYRATGIRRWFVGGRYRDVWTTPVRVPVLDLARYAGGLTPFYPGGGSQTVSLHMRGADGIEYVLRSVDKRPAVPDELRGTLVEEVVKDENSAALVSGALVVAPLLKAAGVLHVTGTLVVIPDDPRLGAYRAEFAGMLAEMEARPRTADGEDAFAGASKVESTDKLLHELATRSDVRVDARGYLVARLMDMYVGDWDRGGVQWRWAHVGDKGDRVWEPVPLDRDWAFARYDGFLNGVLRLDEPELIVFNGNYPGILRLMFQEWQLDRRLLQGLEAPVFDSTARWLQGVLTDSVIDAAVGQMPREEQALRGAQLTQALRQRRAKLPDLARRYYLRMADGADVHATTEPTVVDIDRRADTLDVRFRLRGSPPADPASDPPARPYFERRFARGETNEIRLYLDGGPDSITVRGGGDGILVRVIAAGDGDVLVDSSRHDAEHTAVYDGGHPVRLVDAHSIAVDDRRWSPPPVGHRTLVRDDGSRCLSLPWIGGSSDVGLAVGGVLTCDLFGFRRLPTAVHQRVTAGYTTATGGGLLEYLGQLRPTGSNDLWSLRLRASSADYSRYFGIGDATALGHPERYFEAHQQYYELAPAFTLAVAPHAMLTVGPDLRYWDTGRTSGTYLGLTRPYGLGAFGTVSALADARLDTRDTPALARRGFLVDIRARGVPAWWNAAQSYGRLRGVASTYLTAADLPLSPTLALRAGGEKVWGTAPYQDLAHIGARTEFDPFSVRGYYPDRFSGQASAFGTVQLEVTLAHPKLIVPADLGLIGLNDIGRVFAAGDHASVWHNGTGGGVWAAWLDRTVAGSVVMVHGSEGTRIYVGFGTGF